MSDAETSDYFDRARSIAAAFMVAAGAAAIVGSLLDWVTIEPPVIIPADQAPRTEAFSGVDAKDGLFIIGGGVLLLLFALLIFLRRRSIWGWAGFLVSMIIGAVGVADYRGIEQIFYDEMNRIGSPAPALGLSLVVAAGFIGLVASAAGVAATPRPPPEEPVSR